MKTLHFLGEFGERFSLTQLITNAMIFPETSKNSSIKTDSQTYSASLSAR